MTSVENVDKVLQPLRIPAGWQVDYNILTEFDPSSETIEFFFGEWLFGATHSRSQLGIQVRFEPEGDPSGNYVVDFFRYQQKKPNSGMSSPLEAIQSFSTKSRHHLVQMIEQFMSMQTSIKE